MASQKVTKQGVRDLNSLPGKPRGKTIESPPVPVNCKHPKSARRQFWNGFYEVCDDCGESFNTDW